MSESTNHKRVGRVEQEPPGDPNVVPSWWSPPGMVKKFCNGCDHWFSGWPKGPGQCPECRKRRPGSGYLADTGASVGRQVGGARSSAG